MEKAPTSCNLAAAATRRASARRAAFCGTAAAAFGAKVLAGKFDCFLGSTGDIVQCQFHRGFEVVTSGWSGAPGSSASPAEDVAEKVVKAEDIFEYAADVLPPHMGVVAHANSAQTLVSELVVSLALFGIA